MFEPHLHSNQAFAINTTLRVYSGPGRLVRAPPPKAGWVDKQSPSGFLGWHPWQTRYLHCHGTALHYYKTDADVAAQRPAGVIQWCDVVRVYGEGVGFSVDIATGRTYVFRAATEAEAREWREYLMAYPRDINAPGLAGEDA